MRKLLLKLLVSIILILNDITPLIAQWIRTSGPGVGQIECIIVEETNLFAGTWPTGVFYSTNNGSNWIDINNGLPNLNVTSLTFSGGNLVAGCFMTSGKYDQYTGGFFLSTDNGVSWTTSLQNPSVYCLSKVGNNIYGGTNSRGIYRSTNNGISWASYGSGLPNTVINCLIASGYNLFAGVRTEGVFLSSDSGMSWTSIGPSGNTILDIVINGVNIFTATEDSGVFLSTNNGGNWTAVNSGLDNLYVNALVSIDTLLFAGTWGGGVFLSTNNGTSWTTMNRGLTNYFVRSLTIKDRTLYAGIDGYVWWMNIDETIASVQQLKNDIPVQSLLMQNYPNPFNPTTLIQFMLSDRAFVILKVYNSLGQEVTQLVSQVMNAGIHNLEWNASQFASGIYFYRLVVGNDIKTKKLVLLK